MTVGFVAAVVVLSLPSYRWELLGDLHGDREAITAISDGVGNEDIVVYSGFSALAADYYFEEFSREPGLKFYFPLELDPRVSGVLRLFTTTLLEYREEKGADFAEQASSVTKSILSEDFDEVYLFHATDQRPKDWEIVRHMGHALDSTLELVGRLRSDNTLGARFTIRYESIAELRHERVGRQTAKLRIQGSPSLGQ